MEQAEKVLGSDCKTPDRISISEMEPSSLGIFEKLISTEKLEQVEFVFQRSAEVLKYILDMPKLKQLSVPEVDALGLTTVPQWPKGLASLKVRKMTDDLANAIHARGIHLRELTVGYASNRFLSISMYNNLSIVVTLTKLQSESWRIPIVQTH